MAYDYQIRVKTGASWGAWQSLGALGASRFVRVTTRCSLDTFEFDLAGQTALTDEFPAALAYNADVSIRRADTAVPPALPTQQLFRGRVRSLPRAGSGSSETQRVTVEGPWSWFRDTLFRQQWAEGAGVSKPRAVLYRAADGSRLTTTAQLQAVCNTAIAAGAPFTVPVAFAGGITPPFDEQVNLFCSEAANKCLAYHPHAALYFDYSTETPALRLAWSGSLPAVSVPLTAADGLSIRRRDDMAVPAVCIYYERQTTVDGAPAPTTHIDLYPPSADRFASGVLSAVYDLDGDTVQQSVQVIEAAAFPASLNDPAWWSARVPWLRDYTSVTVSNGRRLHDSTLANLLVSGVRQPWMTTVSSEKERVQCAARCVMGSGSGITEDVLKVITVEVDVTGAPAGATPYFHLDSFEAGESVPAGVAQSIYTEWSVPHHEGSFSYALDETDLAVTPGTALNISGGRAEWAAMKALVSRVTEDIDAGRTTVEFGPGAWLDIDSRVLFERHARQRSPARSRAYAASLPSFPAVQGPALSHAARDGATPAARFREAFIGAADPAKAVVIDPDWMQGSDVIGPGAYYLPAVSGGKVIGAIPCNLMVGGQALGDVIPLDTPEGGNPYPDWTPPPYTAIPQGEGAAAQRTETWTPGGTHGIQLPVVTRVRYNEGDASPQLVAYYRILAFDQHGRCTGMSAEGAYTVFVPAALTI
jgi:hypothetical protein